MSSKLHKKPKRKRNVNKRRHEDDEVFTDYDDYESNDGYHDIDQEYEDDWDKDLDEDKDKDIYDFYGY
ncbi:MAG: hypothetical protein ACOC35_10200 [Promethearchaeia archaeon]